MRIRRLRIRPQAPTLILTCVLVHVCQRRDEKSEREKKKGGEPTGRESFRETVGHGQPGSAATGNDEIVASVPEMGSLTSDNGGFGARRGARESGGDRHHHQDGGGTRSRLHFGEWREVHQSRSISIARNNWGWAASLPALYQSINCWGSSLPALGVTPAATLTTLINPIHLLIDYPDPDPCWTRVRDCCRTVTLQSFFHALGGFFRFWKGSISPCPLPLRLSLDIFGGACIVTLCVRNIAFPSTQPRTQTRFVRSACYLSTLLTRPYGTRRTLDPPAQTTNWTLRIRIPAQQQSSIISSEQRIESPAHSDGGGPGRDSMGINERQPRKARSGTPPRTISYSAPP